MGLGDGYLLDDGEVGGGGGGKASAPVVTCSICLDVVVMGDGDRSWAKLRCGHRFHLDCIGSAFNIKGAMQCPNCRKTEKGQWLYSNGGRQEFNMDYRTHDEVHQGLYDLAYSEAPFEIHWCPFSGLTLPSSFDEGEFPSSAYHDLLGHYAVFSDHAPVPSSTHPCPYVAYFGPVHPSSSTSSGNISDGSSFSNHWSLLPTANEVPNSNAFPSIDAHYHNWDHSSHLAASHRIGSADQPPPLSVTQRTARPRLHPHSSAYRTVSTITSSLLRSYPAPVARHRERPPLQAYFQQSTTAVQYAPYILDEDPAAIEVWLKLPQ